MNLKLFYTYSPQSTMMWKTKKCHVENFFFYLWKTKIFIDITYLFCAKLCE